MDKLEVGKIYTVKSSSGEIDFDYEVLKIENGQVSINILTNRSSLWLMMSEGIKILKYDSNSEFMKNSKEIL